MKPLRKTVLAIGIALSVQALQGMALSAEQSGGTGDASGAKGSSKSFAQTVEEIRNSVNEAWRKLTNPKTVEPARDSVNEGWRKITDPKTIEPARQEVNKAWKGLSDAAGAAVGSSNKSQKESKDKKDKP
jgi:hypothetical protein